MNKTKLDINRLNLWQQQIFAAAMLQRMLPNYQYFAEATEFGDYLLITNQLDLVWQKLGLLPVKFNVELQLVKLQPNIPLDTEFDMFAVYPAIDVCSGLVSLLESFEEKDSQCASDLSLLSLSGVTGYLQLQADEETLENIQSESLYQWELEIQQELFEFAVGAKPSKLNCDKIKAIACEQRLTNLAIEY